MLLEVVCGVKLLFFLVHHWIFLLNIAELGAGQGSLLGNHIVVAVVGGTVHFLVII